MDKQLQKKYEKLRKEYEKLKEENEKLKHKILYFGSCECSKEEKISPIPNYDKGDGDWRCKACDGYV